MWHGIWASRRANEARFRAFVARYFEFRPEDCVVICVSHHAEIHAIYDQIIRQDISATGKSLYKYSWQEAERLMAKLEAACRKWEKDETPGIDSRKYGVVRKRRRR